jgi:class 3 adenylate cyclase/predicted ATPase
MFCDLVDSTPLSQRLDPEDLRDVIRRYQQVCAEAIDRFGGHVARYMGDGLLVYFGYPTAHEDDARRAIRAGLAIVEDVAALSRPAAAEQGVTFAVRAGIHTGLAVIAEMGHGERLERADVVGETPNLAARLQGLAEPNSVLISGATHRLVEDYFRCEALGPQAIKGIAEPVPVFRVIGETGVASRVDAAPASALTPLVGRQQETDVLLEHWRQAASGRMQSVVLSGEPGIGKTRMVRVLREHVGEDAARVELRCSEFHQNSALYPLIDYYQHVLAFSTDDAPDTKARRLEAALAQAGLPLNETFPLLANLLSLPLPDGYELPALSPERLKQKTYESALAWLLALTRHAPVLLTVEDLHWVDPSTLELLSLLIDRERAAPLLALFTARPEFSPPWPAGADLTLLHVGRLSREQVRDFVVGVTGGRLLPEEIIEQIIARTDGVPLFVEELTRMVLESGLVEERDGSFVLTGPLPPLAIPSTLSDSLMARLDRLAGAKELAQLAAAIGREFGYELLSAVSPLDEAGLTAGLARLVDSGLVLQRGAPPSVRYVFKHALVQDAAYDSLLRSRRQLYQRQIAQTLEAGFPDIVEGQPELLAHHYTEAGSIEKAVFYWHMAGVLARERSADREAIAHLTRGLDLVEQLLESAQRDSVELELQIALGPALRATRGYTGAGVESAFSRARELGERLGDKTRLLPALWGLWSFHMVQAHHRISCELADRCLELALELGDIGHIAQAHRAHATSRFWIGDFASAKQHADEGAALYDRERHASYTAAYGIDVGVGCLAWSAWATWYLGYPDEALELAGAALDLAQSLSHPFGIGLAHCWMASVRLCRGETDEARRHAQDAVRLAEEHGMAQWLWYGSVLWGRAESQTGYPEEGIARMRLGVREWLNMSAYTEMPHFSALMAEAHLEIRAGVAAGTFLAEGLGYVAETGERYYEAELYRLRGEALLPDDPPAAERDFLRAIEVSRELSAKSLELRAATSLARFWRDRGRQDEARQLLADVYGWFSEGLETGDLQAAKALLDELCQ